MPRFLLKLSRRSKLHAELDAELAFHRELAAARGNAIGLGNTSAMREEALDLWRFTWLEDFWRDLVYGARGLRRNIGLTTTAVLSLALGIGATTAIFSLVNTYVLRPMPVDRPDRVVAIYLTNPKTPSGIDGLSYPDLADYRRQETGLDSIFGSTGIALSVTDGRMPELIWGEVVTPEYFSGLGLRPILGRVFLPDEVSAPGRSPVCVLNYHFWRRKFHGDSAAIGKSIRVNGHPFTIIGVAPHGFIGTTLFNFVPDVWIPAAMQQSVAPKEGNYLEGRGRRWISTRARLKPGVTLRQAEAALNVTAQQLAAQYPDTNRDLRVHVIPGGGRIQPWFEASGATAKSMALVSVVVLFVLLIACANVANLMLARAQARAREVAIRISIGAGRLRLVRQMLTECLLLSLIGGAVGVALAVAFNRLLAGFYPSLDFQTADLDYEMALDWRVLPFTLAASTAAALVFGLAPALRASRGDQAPTLKGGSSSCLRLGGRDFLLVAQACLSCLLLVFGGLFLRSMQYSKSVDVGFDRQGIAMFGVDLDLQGYPEQQGRRFQQTLAARLRALPGVEEASLAAPLPLGPFDESTTILPESYVPRSEKEPNSAGLSRVGPRYFAAMGASIVAGRAIDERDNETAARVAVVNETLARRYWQTPEQAIGRRFRNRPGGTPVEIVGVARDGKYYMMGEPATAYCFLPLDQSYQGRVTFLMRSGIAKDALYAAARVEAARLDPALPIFGFRTMPEYLNRILSVYEMGACILGAFAAAAMLLATAGIFGVLHFTIVRRTREIGIRVVLGAARSDIVRLVLKRSLLFITAGVLLGVALALAASGMTGSLLAGLRGSDPISFVGALLLLSLMVLTAAVVATRRALRVDPVVALRAE